MVTSYETALKLKEAGMPQPIHAPGQFWYSTIYKGGTQEHNALCVCINEWGFNSLRLVNIRPIIYAPTMLGLAGSVFAPDTAYLIKLIGNDAQIRFCEDETGQIFECTRRISDEIEEMLGHHESNPAEAAAMAWLKINEKK